MGNIPSSDLSKIDVDLDKEILGLQTSALFNDGFISSLVEKLPSYGVSDPQNSTAKDSSNTDVNEAKTNENEQRLEKFMTIFSSELSGCSRVEDFPILSVDKSLANSGFSVMSNRRSRLLIRLFQAYNNQLSEIKSNANRKHKSSGSSLGPYWQLPLDEENGQSASEEEVLSNLSINMSLTLARAFSSQNPGVVKAILQTLLEGLVLYKPLSLRSTPGLEHTLKSIREFAAEMLSISMDLEIKVLAISLQLTMGLLVGSVKTVIQTIEMLAHHDLVLNEKVLHMIEQCIGIPPDFDISFPSTKNPHDKFSFSIEVSEDKKQLKTVPQLISITCDGTFFFVYDGFSGMISKIGSGLNGTLPGEVICTSKPLRSLISDLNVEKEEPSSIVEPTSSSVSDALLFFSSTKKSDLIVLSNDNCTASCLSEDNDRYCSVLIDQLFPAQRGGEFSGKSYFEITVERVGDGSVIGIGWCTSNFSLDGSEMVGWADGTFAFHSDGELHGSNEVSGSEDEDDEFPSWNVGDVIGCGIDHSQLRVFFTFNGRVVAKPFSLSDSSLTDIYPVVCFEARCSVTLNTGQIPFRYSGPLVSGPMMRNSVQNVASSQADKSQLLASLAVNGNKLFVHFNQGLHSRSVAVFHSASLEYSGQLDLTPAIQHQIVESNGVVSPSAALDDVYEFAIDSNQDVFNIRATKGYMIDVLEATVGDVDVIDTIKNLRNDGGSSLFSKNLREVLPHGSGGLKLKCKCVPKEANRLCLPITSADNSLFFIEQTNGSSASAKRIYNALSELRFSMATAETPLDGEFDVLSAVNKLWISYLEKIHDNRCEVNSFKDDFREILAVGASDAVGDGESEESPPENDTDNDHSKKKDKVNIAFVFSDNQKSSINFTESCQWNCIIAELEDAIDHRIPAFNVLKIQMDQSPCLQARFPLLCRGYDPLKAEFFNSSSLLCNGHQLMLIDSSPVGSDAVRSRGWKFSLDKKGEIQRFYNKKFVSKGCGTPTSFCFDVRNNMIVGFDSSSSSVLKWRNSGFSPNAETSPSELEKDPFLDSSPANRLRFLWQQFTINKEAKLQVPILLSLLDKLSEPYGCNPFDGANIDALYQVMLSAKWTHGNVEKNRCVITIRDSVVEFDDDGDENENQTGFHIVVLNKHTFAVEKTRWFNNSGDNAKVASNRMADFLNDLEEGSVILLANAGTVHENIGRYGVEALMNYGACDLETVERSHGMVMIGIKGLRPGTADCVFGEAGENVKLLRFLPPRAIPLRLEPTPDAIISMLKLCQHFMEMTLSQGNSVFSQLCFSCALRLLQVNLYNFTHRTKPEDFVKNFDDKRGRELKMFLEKLMVSCLMQISVVRDASVGLFVAALNLVYPRTEDQVLLLDGYAKKYQNQSISDAELSLLQVLLRRFLKSNDLISVFKNGKLEYDNILRLIEVVQLIIQQETEDLVIKTLLPNGYSSENPIYSAAVQLLTSLSKSVLAFAAEPLIKGSESFSNASSEISRIFEVVSVVSKLSTLMLLHVTKFAEEHKEVVVNTPLILDLLQRSPVGSILPITTMTVSELVRSLGYKFISISMESVLSAINELDGCLSQMSSVLALLSAEANQYNDSVPQKQSSTKIFESEHPYRSNMDERTAISFPGALSVTITFDQKSRSEHSCDYVIFQDKSGSSLHPQVDKFSGRDGNENWPGVGGRPSLTLNSNDFICYFHSDGSVEDWGYKFTATASYPLKMTTVNRLNWLAKMSFEVVQSLSLIGAGMLQGTPWNDEVENSCASWMENPLVKPEYFRNPEHGSALRTDADEFLLGLIDRKSNVIADKFLRKIRLHVPEDQGAVEVVNNAVYATCAAIIRGNNLAAEAMAFANGTRSEPSAALTKAWKAGQKMRNYFDLNDMKVSMGVQPQIGKSKLQSSIYAGAPEEVIKAASEAVMMRAKFLLRSTTTVSMEGSPAETTSASDDTPLKLSPLVPLTSENNSPHKSLDNSPVNKWGLVSKAIKLQRQVSHETKNVQAMWHSLVDEAVVLDKLKNVFLQRRKFVEKAKVGKELTLTEKILGFVQSDVDINKLHEANAIRNKRAIVRSKGFDVFARLLHDKASPFAIFITTATYITALIKFRREDGGDRENLHFAHSLEGCSPEQNNLLWQKFFSFLTNCVSTILRSHSTLCAGGNADEGLWEKALVNSLRACAMDYDVTDHQTIYESEIITILEQILRSKSSILVKQTAGALLETIVSRFIVFDTSSETGEVTELNKSLITMLANLLAESKNDISISSPSADASLLSTNISVTEVATPLMSIDETVIIRSMSGGRSIPHFDLPFDHTVAFTIGREKSFIDDSDVLKIVPGSFVTRSIYWSDEKNRSDGGLGNVGVITNVLDNGKKVSVKWPHGKEHVHTISIDNSDSEAKPEVVLADPNIAGYLFTKGSPGIVSENEINKTTPVITILCGQLLADGTLLITYEFSNKTIVRLRSKEKIAASRWVHIALCTDLRSKLTVFIDGKCVESTQLPAVNYCGSATLSLTSPNEAITLPSIDSAACFVLWVEEANVVPQSATFLVQSDELVQAMIQLDGENDFPGRWSSSLRVDPESNISIMTSDGEDHNLNVTAELKGISAADVQCLSSSTTKLPWQFGHPSAYHRESLSIPFVGVNFILRNFSVFGSALSAPAVRHLASISSIFSSFDKENTLKVNEISVLNVLGILRRSLTNLDNLADSPMRRCFANCGIITMLFEQFTSSVPNIRVAAYQLASHIFPAMDVELIDGNGLRVLKYGREKSFLDFLCDSIGEGFNTWRRRAACVSQQSLSLQSVDEDMHSIIFAQLELLRSFAAGRKDWQERLSILLKSLVDFALASLPQLKKAGRLSFNATSSNTWDPDHLSIADRIFSLLAIFGGNPLGKFVPGARVTYFDDSSGLAENAVVLGPVAIPQYDIKDKDAVKKWSFAKNFGDAVAILFDSDPKTSHIVPIHSLSITVENNTIPANIFELLRAHVGVDKTIAFFRELISIDLTDPRPKHGPIDVLVDEERVFESAHPYPDNKEHFESIAFDGAEKIEIVFDDQSRTEDGCDYVIFYHDISHKAQFGEKFMGRNGSENFPGFGGRDPLIIPSSKFVLHFHSDTSGNDWGYKFIAKAKCRKQLFPPELPPVPNQYIASSLKMLGMKALMSMTKCDWILESMVSLLPEVMDSALSPKPDTTVLTFKNSSSEQLVFESTHPYMDSMDVYTPVSVPGATRFTITFDPDTRTESNCDYMIFYTDNSHSTKVLDSETYTGGKDGSSSNWPGLNGKAPLIIEGDSFVFFFHSDSSVNDWGYRMFITVEKQSNGGSKSVMVRGKGMSAVEAETCTCILQGLLNEGVGIVEDNVYSTLSKFSILPAKKTSPLFTSVLNRIERLGEESKEESDLVESKADDASTKQDSLVAHAILRFNPPKTKVFATLLTSDVALHLEPNKESQKLETLSSGQKLILSENISDVPQLEWVQVQKVQDFDEETFPKVMGWILRRSGSGDICFRVQDFGEEIIEELSDEQLTVEKSSKASAVEKSRDREYRNPMFCVDNGKAASLGEGKKSGGVNVCAVDVAVQDYSFVDQAIAEYSAIAAIDYANQGVTKILENWPSKFIFSEHYFGSMENLLRYINLCIADVELNDLSSTNTMNSKAMAAKRFYDVIIRDSANRTNFDQDAPGVVLLHCAQQLLEMSTSQRVEKLSKPVKRGKQKSIESTHPYEHNLNHDWPISFPGAKKLELRFSAESTTETNYDYVTIYTDASKSTKAYPEKIHGYRSASQRHWPGVNVPPIIIDGSSCVVNFTTDGGTNDWGFQLNIFAVYEEPSEAELRAYAENAQAPAESSAKLAISIFHYFATQLTALSTALRIVFFTVENFRTLIKFFNSPESTNYRAQLLDIFVVFINTFTNEEVHAGKIFKELVELEKSLVGYANEQYSTETNKGTRTQGASPELQSTVQMIITLQAAISAIRSRLASKDLEMSSQLSLKALPRTSTEASDGPTYRTLYHPESTNSKSVVVWEVRLKRISDSNNLPFIGLMSDITGQRSPTSHIGDSSASTELSICGSTMTVNGKRALLAACKPWSEGDVIVMNLDRLNGLVEFSLNGVALPLMIGPPTKSPVFEMSIVGIDCYFAVSLAHPDDEVEVRFLDKNSRGKPNGVDANADTSGLDWLQPVREVQSILQSITNKQIPQCIILSKFLPFCNKKATLHLNLTSYDLLESSVFSREIFFESASQISIVVEESCLHNSDVIEFVNRDGIVLATFSGDSFTVSNVQQLNLFINKITAHSVERSKSNALTGRAKQLGAGDKVTRSPSWQYGNEDGGLGSVGDVIKVHEKGSKASSNVVVRWSNGFEGSYDSANVVVFENPSDLSANVVASFHRASDGTFTFIEDFVQMRVRCSAESLPSATAELLTAKERKLSLHIVPCLSPGHCLRDPLFASFRDRLSSLYVVKNRAVLSSLVKHINKVAREKQVSRDELLCRKWAEVSPSSQDLTRSATLKELFELEALAWDEDDLAIASQNLVFTSTATQQTGVAATAEEEEQVEEEEPQGEIQLSEQHRGFYLSEYASWGGIHEFESLEFALMAARQVYPACQGITQEGRTAFTLRAGNELLPSPSGETSWLLVPPPKKPTRKRALLTPIVDDVPSLQLEEPAENFVNGLNQQQWEVNDFHSDEGNEDEGDEDDEEDDGSGSEHDRRSYSNNSEESDDDEEEEEEEEEEEGRFRFLSSRSSDSNDDSEEEQEEEVDSSNRSLSPSSPRIERNDQSLLRTRLSGVNMPPLATGTEMCTPIPTAAALPCCAKCNKAVRLHPSGTWSNGWSCDWPEHQGYNSFTRNDPVYGCETIGPCNWGICLRCWANISGKIGMNDEHIAQRLRQSVLNVDASPIEALFGLLQLLNHAVIKALPLIDLTRNDKIPGTLSQLISSNRDLIFETVKKMPFDEAVTSTTGTGSQFELYLSRFRARKNATAGKVDADGRWSVFSQAFRVIHPMNPSILRRSDKLYNTKFMGEHAQDAGGPYRESFDNYAEELQSPVLPLLIRTPNGRHAVGYNREKWILNPSSTSSVQLEMFAFVGKLMGIAIRSKEYMSLNIPSIIWKLIAGDSPTKEDLEGVDFSLISSLDLLRNIDKNGVDELTFSSTFFETFTTTSSDDRVVELISGGKDIDVTFSNRHQYCDLVLQYRLHEFDRQAAAIREGLATIIPISLLSMFRWDELEEMVCGKPDIDVKLLENVVEYSSCSSSDAHIRLFWQALEEFTNEERSAFIKFTWGRSRLPLNAAGFTQRFKLQSFDKHPADNYLPVAHTCFFSLELPRYSTLEIMKEKLRYAIFNCQAIDGDETSTGMTVAAMGWEEEEE